MKKQINLQLIIFLILSIKLIFAYNCADTTALQFKAKFTKEDINAYEDLITNCRNKKLNDIEDTLVIKNIVEITKSTVAIDSSNICLFSMQKTNYRYSNLCEKLGTNTDLMNYWTKAFNSKKNRILSGMAMSLGSMAAFLIGMNIYVDDCEESVSSNIECVVNPTPIFIMSIPTGIIFYWGLFRMITTGNEINEAVKITDIYYSKNE